MMQTATRTATTTTTTYSPSPSASVMSGIFVDDACRRPMPMKNQRSIPLPRFSLSKLRKFGGGVISPTNSSSYSYNSNSNNSSYNQKRQPQQQLVGGRLLGSPTSSLCVVPTSSITSKDNCGATLAPNSICYHCGYTYHNDGCGVCPFCGLKVDDNNTNESSRKDFYTAPINYNGSNSCHYNDTHPNTMEWQSPTHQQQPYSSAFPRLAPAPAAQQQQQQQQQSNYVMPRRHSVEIITSSPQSESMQQSASLRPDGFSVPRRTHSHEREQFYLQQPDQHHQDQQQQNTAGRSRQRGPSTSIIRLQSRA